MKKQPKLFAPESYWKASKKMLDMICNGCGTKGLGGWLVPDTLWGLNVTPCCHIHDWMYNEGNAIEDKDVADRAFLNNMSRTIDAKSGRLLKPLRRLRAKSYYNAVKYFGGDAFWSGKNKSGEMKET